MIGEYINTRMATISPAVPGAQYRVIAWSIGSNSESHRRSATPAVRNATTGEKSESYTLY